MRRFAKLTRNGSPLYVDPALVGVIYVMSPPQPGAHSTTTLLGNGAEWKVVADCIEEPPDEVYRRLAAAAAVVTKKEYEEVQCDLSEAVLYAGAAIHDAWPARAADEKKMIAMLIKPIQDVYDKLKKTTLAALWVAEGEEPQK